MREDPKSETLKRLIMNLGKRNGKMVGTVTLNDRGNNSTVLARLTKWGMESFKFVNETQAVKARDRWRHSVLNETLNFDLIKPGRCWFVRVSTR
tara:strand:+ start:508 stop:789 length:282 start_codon:yes stop_codon:yes gene_type:complete